MIAQKIYFDMDGVLADFDRGIRDLCSRSPLSQNAGNPPEAEDELWAAVRKIPHFYDKLEPMPGAVKLFHEVYDRYGGGCEILTGIPKPRRQIESAGEDKKNWVKRLLSADVVVNIVFREDKPRFCTGPECILVDDLERNIRDWNEMGGTGILHTSADETLKQLKTLGVL